MRQPPVPREQERKKRVTRSRIAELDADERIEEVARMLGGITITPTTRDHAREMLQNTRAA